jgi:hypothetical protein
MTLVPNLVFFIMKEGDFLINYSENHKIFFVFMNILRSWGKN